MQIQKELITLDPCSFKRFEDYLIYTKDMKFKLGEPWKDFPKINIQLIEIVLMNLWTPYDVLYSSVCTN